MTFFNRIRRMVLAALDQRLERRWTKHDSVALKLRSVPVCAENDGYRRNSREALAVEGEHRGALEANGWVSVRYLSRAGKAVRLLTLIATGAADGMAEQPAGSGSERRADDAANLEPIVDLRTRTGSKPRRSGSEREVQWRGALGRANDVRCRRAGLKRELAAGTLTIVDVLADPPTYAKTAKVRQLLLAVPHFGPVKAHRLLLHCHIAEGKTVARLTDRQRDALIEQLSA